MKRPVKRPPATRTRRGRLARASDTGPVGVAAADTAGETAPAPEPAAATRPIRVEIDEAVSGWPMRGRFDVMLRGHVTSGVPIETFSIRDPNGLELAALQFGHGEAQPPVTLADGETVFRTGFQIYVPMPGGEQVRVADMWVRAEDRDGGVFEESMRIGCMADRAAILAGPARELSDVERPASPGIVYLEAAEVTDDGRFLVHGWALATSPIVAVQIFADGARVSAALQGRERSDVAAAYPDYPNARFSGFSLERAADDAVRAANSVAAQVLCLSGACFATMIPLVRPPFVPGTAAPVLVICDHAHVSASGVLVVEGWASAGAGIERVAIEVDGVAVGDAAYGRERPDVAEEYPGVPAAVGFGFQGRVPGLSGDAHAIRVIAFSRTGVARDVTVTITPPPPARFRVELDGPKTQDGIAIQPITGRLVVEGWALARDGVAAIDVLLDGTLLGQAHFGMARPDVAAAFPDWEGGARSGYNFHCPARALPDGEHTVQVVTRSKTGEKYELAFRVIVRKTDDPEAEAAIRRRVNRVERLTIEGVLDQLRWRPRFQLIATGAATDAAVGDATPEAAWDLTLRSIVEQSWPDWRLTVLAGDAGDAAAARAAIARLTAADAERCMVLGPDAAARDAPLASLAGDAALFALFACGDELGRDALAQYAVASGIERDADCFYADEFRSPPGGTRAEAFFKPDLSPLLLLAQNYIGRPLVARPALLAAIGTTADALARDGFHDLALRCVEAARQVHHVPLLLSRTDFGHAADADDGAAALRAAIARRGLDAELLPGATPGTWRVRRGAAVGGKVSIIIPTCAAHGYIRTCLTTLREMTAWRDFEIVVIDNIPDDAAQATEWKAFVQAHADRVVTMAPPFNWSRFNNAAAAAADGEYLLFLNDDIEIIEPGWLDAMLEAAAWPDVGIVGARLLYPNRTVQHAGMFLGAGMGRHAFRHAAETEPGYFGLAQCQREVIAVTGACLLVRRDVFDRLGRFDEAHEVVNNDMDFCLRAYRAGLRTIYTPHATLIHHELASRAHLPDDFDTSRFTGAWQALFAAGDPYFNPNLSRYADDYRIDDEGVRAGFSGHPLLAREAVRSILAVKLDHIGDFITALPAIRRLKAAFPTAWLVALVAPASAAIAAVEPAIDECLPFEFFFERSELGEKELSEDDLAALRARLAPYHFDIAIDLRKHPDTRPVLRCSGAKLLAGYDALDSFPWLDIVLEWDGDKAMQRKRSHIVDDLVNLVRAVEQAAEPDRALFDPLPVALAPDELPEYVRPLFARPVVAIHPGSGNVMRQWPEKHIPPLIALLLERTEAAVLLIGGRDDEEKAAAILRQVGASDRVASVAGQVPLRELPRWLAACALFIGGNSGPKHIAAASGVPTIGIHSGVVDPGEWGPIGARAVALYRDMSCAPCFLSKPEHCPRGMDCVEKLDPAPVFQMARTFLARRETRSAIAGAPRTAEASAGAPGAAPPHDAVPPDRPLKKRARSLTVTEQK